MYPEGFSGMFMRETPMVDYVTPSLVDYMMRRRVHEQGVLQNMGKMRMSASKAASERVITKVRKMVKRKRDRIVFLQNHLIDTLVRAKKREERRQAGQKSDTEPEVEAKPNPKKRKFKDLPEDLSDDWEQSRNVSEEPPLLVRLPTIGSLKRKASRKSKPRVLTPIQADSSETEMLDMDYLQVVPLELSSVKLGLLDQNENDDEDTKMRIAEFLSEAEKVWKAISVQIVRVSKLMNNRYNMKVSNHRRLSKVLQKEAVRRTQVTRNAATAAKKLMRETMSFWRQNEKIEKQDAKKAQQLALEQQKIQDDEREKQRQEKKLNFLLSQTELFCHFVSAKIQRPDQEQLEQKEIDTKALKTHFPNLQMESTMACVSQPKMLACTLKEYQFSGLQWLASLYEQGINGILADEMGLGKTVQAISLLAWLAEERNVWGPHLIVTPASTLHNWLQEIKRFAPKLNALPYWGDPSERQVLRQVWSRKKMFNSESQAHIIVTSYQFALSDLKYLVPMKWEYLILDEAQAIKSSSSLRWNSLLQLNARCRLLLTGTPVQNSLKELWALLHFIMPSLFDSHEEFTAWFAKDIESAAANRRPNMLNAIQVKRLHLILQPFMLRRLKSQVQSELGEKIEINVPCELTLAQTRLYSALKRKITVNEILESCRHEKSKFDKTSHLMNLVMQLRKVCNHPELMEHSDISSPFCFSIVKSQILQTSRDLFRVDVPSNPISLFIPRTLFFANFYTTKLIHYDPINQLNSRELLELDEHYIPKSLFIVSPPCVAPQNLHIVRKRFNFPYNFFDPLTLNDTFVSLHFDPPIHLVRKELPKTNPPVTLPDSRSFLLSSGKILALESLLPKLKAQGHRCLVYFQMTRMMDLMEKYLKFRKYSYLRLDGSTSLGDRRDLVSDWQTRDDLFIFILSTRAGGVGINLTAADTVIFFDSDWNPTVDRQAMDRAHRLGQTKQVTVYRLFTAHTIEEKILERARTKDDIQKLVISGSLVEEENEITQNELVSMLLEDEDKLKIPDLGPNKKRKK